MYQTQRKIRSRAPLRLGLAGGGTDLSPYCDEYGGAILNATIDRYAHVSLTLGGDLLVMEAGDLDQRDESSAAEVDIHGPLKLHRAVYARVCRQFLAGRRQA
jgi:D-glycero-alpha-D-manno-heptose-7-phosphate kinase